MKLNKSTPPEGTVRDWLDARARAGGTAVTFPETRGLLTWHQLRAEARQIASDLTARGIAKGDSVAVIHPNGREGVIALYAALYGGFRATMINLAAGPDAIGYALEHSEAKIAFVKFLRRYESLKELHEREFIIETTSKFKHSDVEVIRRVKS